MCHRLRVSSQVFFFLADLLCQARRRTSTIWQSSLRTTRRTWMRGLGPLPTRIRRRAKSKQPRAYRGGGGRGNDGAARHASWRQKRENGNRGDWENESGAFELASEVRERRREASSTPRRKSMGGIASLGDLLVTQRTCAGPGKKKTALLAHTDGEGWWRRPFVNASVSLSRLALCVVFVVVVVVKFSC